jgi:GTP cyclohydrolase I
LNLLQQTSKKGFKYVSLQAYLPSVLDATLYRIMKKDNIDEAIDEMGDAFVSPNTDTPMRKDAFEISDEEKIERIQKDVQSILDTLGLDLTDDSLKGTPKRVAKMFVKEVFGGLHPQLKPKASTFQNKYKYGEMLVEKNITLYSTCEHHLLPIVGRAHVGYISNGTVVGLSKMNRIVDYYAKRPQVQERLTMQIVKELQEVLGTEDVACVIDAKHLCVNSRGIRDIESSTVTSEYGGRFKDPEARRDFLDYINLETEF